MVLYHTILWYCTLIMKVFKMPKAGYKVITLREDVYRKIEKLMIEENYKAGYRKFKSLPEFLEYIIEKFYEKEVRG